MWLKLKAYLVAIAVLQSICLCMIMMGITGGYDAGEYDPQEYDKSREKTSENLSTNTADAEVKMPDENIPEKVVLVVIDALRLDFISEENFPFLIGTLAKYQSTSVLKFDVKVDSPTVTLPRVKTLVTGRAPVYLDVLRNFQTADTLDKKSSGLNQPNLISLLRKELPDLNICFFGDETWLRLFPAEDDKYSPYFKKWEGVTSFYVRDFYEVDNNVTRHLDTIDECNFLILHYLGLDHIGHVYGPKYSDLVKPKLAEMDRVIQHLHSHLANMQTKKSKNLMLITGDHGMANAGGHGGSSAEEVFTPLIAAVVGGMPQHRHKLEAVQINQIDIAPTLASIWNIDIPQESRGQLILDIIEHFKTTDQLANSYQKNCKHLLNVLGKNRKAATYNLWWTEISKMEKPLAIKKYIELEQELSSVLQNAKDSSNNLFFSFILSVVLLIIMEIYLFSCLKKILGRYACFTIALVFIPPLITYFSSSFIEEEHYIRYYLYSAILITFLWIPEYNFDSTLTVLQIMLLHRLAISFNQTGDKWSHLPDINDFIVEQHLHWLTATIAVILIYIYSHKTVKCSNFFKAALFTLYITKLITTYIDESFRGKLHWLLMDGKLQKISFLTIFLHFVHHLRVGSVHQAVFSTTLVILLSLQRCQNFLVLALVFVQVNLLEKLVRLPLGGVIVQRSENSTKSSNRLNSILSRVLIVWFAQASFYYQGNSNGLATVDVNAGYIGIESYSSNILIGSLILLNTFSSPIIVYLFMAKNVCSDEVFANGSAHSSNHTSSKTKLKSKEKATKLEYLPFLLLLSNGAECVIYVCSIMIFQNHLFIWSVFVPKLMYLITQSIVCAIASGFYVFIN